MNPPRSIIVTGANRGIGKAICKSILERNRTLQLKEARPLKLFATSRVGFELSRSLALGQDVQIVYPKLDVSDHDSIRALVDEVKRNHGANVDILINNAGVNLDLDPKHGYGYENARRTLNVNYRGTKWMCQNFIPLMRPHAGRIVNLSSVASSLKIYSETVQRRFRDTRASLEDLDRLAEDYLTSVKDHREVESGFGHPGRSYNISKALVNSLTAILARDHPDLLINCCCPGWVGTDMGAFVGRGRSRPPKSPDEGAKIPVRLALDDIDGVSGKYWANSTVRSKLEGSVQNW